jgi:bacterioferritin-associated ferredoxin
MIVCVCNALSSSSCANVAGSGRCRSVGCLYRLQGARVRCGKCVPVMQDLFDRHNPGVPAAPADGTAATPAVEAKVAA